MAVKNPLALYSGKIKELQPGDTVPGSGGGGVSIKQVLFDYGGGKTFLNLTVNDANVTPSSQVIASLYNDGNISTALPFLIIIACGNISQGSFTMFTRTADGKPYNGNFRVNYLVGSTG